MGFSFSMVLLRVLLRVPQTNFDILLAYEVRGLKTTPCSSLRGVKPIFFSLRKMLFLPPDVAETRGSHTGTVNPKLRRGGTRPPAGALCIVFQPATATVSVLLYV